MNYSEHIQVQNSWMGHANWFRLKDNGCFVAIVSAGVDLFVGSIASMLGADDWVANGFIFDEDGYLTDEGNCRLHATGKGEIIEKLCQQHGFEGKEVISVGDSEMDLSMWIKDSKFIGFNPTRELKTSFPRCRRTCDKYPKLFGNQEILRLIQANGIEVLAWVCKFITVSMHGFGWKPSIL